jgi:zinc transporter 2
MIVSFFLAGEAARRGWLIFLQLDSNGVLLNSVDGRAMSIAAALGVVVNLCLVAILGDHYICLPGYDGDVADDHSDSRLNNCDLSDSSDDSDSVFSYSTEDSPLLEHLGQNDKGKNGKGFETRRNNVTKSSEKSRNIYSHAAYTHVISDLVQCFFVFLAGILIWYDPMWQFMDPICTIAFCYIVARSTCGVFFSSIQVLMNTAPPDIDWLQVYNAFNNVKGVSNIHNLHIWVVSEGNTALSVHGDADDIEEALHSFHDICKRFRIRHSTIQLHPHSLETYITCRYVL